MKHRTSIVLVAALLNAAAADAQKVAIVSAGNELITGGWCNVNAKTLAPGAAGMYSLSGRIDNPQYSSIVGKYRMKNATNKFEWASGEPAVTFTTSNATPTSFSLRAKTTTVAATYTINFAAVDDAGVESETRSCKITVTAAGTGTGTGTGTTTQKQELATEVTSFRKEGETAFSTSLTNGEVPSGDTLRIKVTVKNLSTSASAPVRLSLMRLDHTCGGYPVTIHLEGAPGSTYIDVPSIPANSTRLADFTDSNPPKPDLNSATPIGTSAVVCYKTGLRTATNTLYSDSINTNHTAYRYVKYVASSAAPTTPVVVKFGDYLFGKFTNAKCINCHSFTDNASTKRAIHNSEQRTTSTTDVTSSANCTSCHNAEPTQQPCNASPACVANWHAAPATANWSGKSAAQTCTLVKAAPLPSGHTLSSHLKTDPFVVWAVEKAFITLTEWRTKVDEWINGGMTCE